MLNRLTTNEMASGQTVLPAVPPSGQIDPVASGEAAGQAIVVPGGQSINVLTNHNIHLPRNEWLFRGIVGALGHAAAWPFRLVAQAISAAVVGVVNSVLSLVKMALIVIAIPTLIWLGIELRDELQTADSVETGTVIVTDHAGEVIDGVSKGLSR